MRAILALALWASLVLCGEGAFRLHRSRTDAQSLPAFNLQAEIDGLSSAVQAGDVAAVERITSMLLNEAKTRASEKGNALAHDSAAVAKKHVHSQEKAGEPVTKTAQTQATRLNQAKQISNKTYPCLLDDYLFQLTPEGKEGLKKELQEPSMVEAITWTKTGGWWTCATFGELCMCKGNVRMVDELHTAWSGTVNARPWGGVTWCNDESFAGHTIAPTAKKMCQCSYASDGSDYHLEKRLTSKAYMQEMWIFLLRLLGRNRLLPTGTGDRLYHGIENWAARRVPGTMPMVLERIWIDMFMRQVVVHHGPGPRCLEWGDGRTPGVGFNYINMVPQCTDKVDMQYDAVHWGQKGMGIEGNVVYSDIDNLPRVLMTGGDHRVNLIFATQVFEHLANPHEAAKRLHESLLPGGALVFTAPQQAQFHLVPHDYYRYTKEGAVHTLQQAGFCVLKSTVTGGGDFIFDIARDAGLLVQDFPGEDIIGAYQTGYDAVSDSAITIHVLAFKQPHTACATAMPPILPPR